MSVPAIRAPMRRNGCSSTSSSWKSSRSASAAGSCPRLSATWARVWSSVRSPARWRSSWYVSSRPAGGQQDSPVAVSLDLSSVKGEARQPGRFSQGQIHAEHATDAVPELGQGHRLVVVVVGGLVLAGEEPHELRAGRPEGELTAFGSCETEADPAHPGDVDVAVLEQGRGLGHGDHGEPLDLWVREARERDAGQVAHPAAGPVAGDEVSGSHPILPVRAAHV